MKLNKSYQLFKEHFDFSIFDTCVKDLQIRIQELKEEGILNISLDRSLDLRTFENLEFRGDKYIGSKLSEHFFENYKFSYPNLKTGLMSVTASNANFGIVYDLLQIDRFSKSTIIDSVEGEVNKKKGDVIESIIGELKQKKNQLKKGKEKTNMIEKITDFIFDLLHFINVIGSGYFFVHGFIEGFQKNYICTPKVKKKTKKKKKEPDEVNPEFKTVATKLEKVNTIKGIIEKNKGAVDIGKLSMLMRFQKVDPKNVKAFLEANCDHFVLEQGKGGCCTVSVKKSQAKKKSQGRKRRKKKRISSQEEVQKMVELLKENHGVLPIRKLQGYLESFLGRSVSKNRVKTLSSRHSDTFHIHVENERMFVSLLSKNKAKKSIPPKRVDMEGMFLKFEKKRQGPSNSDTNKERIKIHKKMSPKFKRYSDDMEDKERKFMFHIVNVLMESPTGRMKVKDLILKLKKSEIEDNLDDKRILKLMWKYTETHFSFTKVGEEAFVALKLKK